MSRVEVAAPLTSLGQKDTALNKILQGAASLLGRHAPALKRFVPANRRTQASKRLFLALPDSGKTASFARRFRSQAAHCERAGSPLYGRLLEVAAVDIERRGPCWNVVQSYAERRLLPPPAAPLAFMAAVHQVVLEHPGSVLEPYYPSTGGDTSRVGLDAAFLEVISAHGNRIRELLHRPVQTNEVARSRVLLGGFLTVAHETQLPLRVLEFGASAGLNLRWDQYRYEVDDLGWGARDSPLHLVDGFIEGRPPLHLEAEVAERRGCDLSPIDPRSEDGQIKLVSHVWADQVDRLEQLRAAFLVAATVDAPVEAADALAWVTAMLGAPVSGVATVVYDTCMMEYLDPAVRSGIHQTIEGAGARAADDCPLAFLHLAPSSTPGEEELSLTTWPGGVRRLLASCDPYARKIRWHATEDAQ